MNPSRVFFRKAGSTRRTLPQFCNQDNTFFPPILIYPRFFQASVCDFYVIRTENNVYCAKLVRTVNLSINLLQFLNCIVVGMSVAVAFSDGNYCVFRADSLQKPREELVVEP